jgi:hypothetical protein
MIRVTVDTLAKFFDRVYPPAALQNSVKSPAAGDFDSFQ